MGYAYLAAAIALELAGTTCMKYADGFTNLLPSIGTLAFYGCCFFMFSKALQTVDLNIAYATWSGVGIVGATALSVLVFGEVISVPSGIGLALIAVGVIMVNLCKASGA